MEKMLVPRVPVHVLVHYRNNHSIIIKHHLKSMASSNLSKIYSVTDHPKATLNSAFSVKSKILFSGFLKSDRSKARKTFTTLSSKFQDP